MVGEREREIREQILMLVCLTCFYSFFPLSDGTIRFYARKNIISQIFRFRKQVLVEILNLLSNSRSFSLSLSLPQHSGLGPDFRTKTL